MNGISSIIETSPLSNFKILPNFESQREDLLIWNQGTRVFLRQLINKRISEKKTINEVENLLLPLEHFRMFLAPPTETEVCCYNTRIQVVFNAYVTCNIVSAGYTHVATSIVELLSDDTLGVFERCCTRIIGCGISSEPTSILINIIDGAYQDLDKLGGQHVEMPCPLAWKILIGKWLQLAQQVRGEIILPPEKRNAWIALGGIFPTVED